MTEEIDNATGKSEEKTRIEIMPIVESSTAAQRPQIDQLTNQQKEVLISSTNPNRKLRKIHEKL